MAVAALDWQVVGVDRQVAAAMLTEKAVASSLRLTGAGEVSASC